MMRGALIVGCFVMAGCPRTDAELVPACALEPRWSVQTGLRSLYPLATTSTGDVLVAFGFPIEIDGTQLSESTLVLLHDGSLVRSRQLPGSPAAGPIAISDAGFGVVTLFGPDAMIAFDSQLETRWMGARGAGADVAPTGEVVTSASNVGLTYFDATGAPRWSDAYAFPVHMTASAEVFAWTLTRRTHYASTGQVIGQVDLPQATLDQATDRSGRRVDVSGTVVRRVDPAGISTSVDVTRPVRSPVISTTGATVALLADQPELARIDQTARVGRRDRLHHH